MRPVRLVVGLAAALAAIAGAAPAGAFEPLGAPFVTANPALRPPGPAILPSAAPGRSPVVLPPAYPAPPRGSVTLPSSGEPLVFPVRVSPRGDHVWVPGRTETTLNLGADGRIRYGLEYVPGRFERQIHPGPDR
jgi:hypothetical protein